MKIFRNFFILLMLSIFFTFLILIFFSPILTAKNLIFPYSIHPFDIAQDYPKAWFYIKIFYCFSLYISIFLTLNSLNIFLTFNFKKKKFNKKDSVDENLINKNNLNLLVGINPDNQKQVFITEKGLYQNILVTGTIGSRKNKFCNVSFFRTTN